MKNNKLFLTAILSLSMLSACVKSSDLGGLGYYKPTSKWAQYKADALSGTVFNQPWKATSAVAKAISGNPNEVSIEFYAEDSSVSCTNSAIPRKPYATLVIPSQYQMTEYIADMQSMTGGNPLVFTEFAATSKNVIADKTKLLIQSIDDNGFKASLYAQGTEQNGTVSEINGSFYVMDCRKAVDFSVWDSLVGWYNLSSFDGVPKNGNPAIIDYDKNNNFYDPIAKKYVKTLVFPLYTSVSDRSDVSLSFGPMEGHGRTTVVDSKDRRTLTYSFHGTITYRGTPTKVDLDLEVIKEKDTLSISYTFEAPDEVKKTSHSFVLKQ